MPRKKITDKPVPSALETSAATQTQASKKTRAPGASSNAVTHKHKKTATPTAAEVAIEIVAAVGTATAATAKFQQPTHEEIAILAYHIAESRGFQGGSPDEDWLRAERELIAGLA
jgi:hypothetical protein